MSDLCCKRKLWIVRSADTQLFELTTFFFLYPAKASNVWIAVIAVAIVIMCGVVGVLYYRRRRFERDLELMLWKVNYSDINFIKGYRFNSDGDPVMRVVCFQTVLETLQCELVDKFYSTKAVSVIISIGLNYGEKIILMIINEPTFEKPAFIYNEHFLFNFWELKKQKWSQFWLESDA